MTSLPAASVTCRMEGDTFEMEDQRNWTDASYKTYVRPLALPWPYTLAKGTQLEQAVRLSVAGNAPPRGPRGDSAVMVRIGEATGAVPALGVGLAPEDVDGVVAAADLLAQLRPGICRLPPRPAARAMTRQARGGCGGRAAPSAPTPGSRR